jgi:hypothetical protein
MQDTERRTGKIIEDKDDVNLLIFVIGDSRDETQSSSSTTPAN